MTEKNPFLEPENYFEGYNKSIESMKNHPSVVELDRLCYQVFNTSDEGKKLIEVFKERFLLPSIPAQLNKGFETTCVYYEGYREAFRQIIQSVRNYQERMEHEAKSASDAKGV